MVSLKEPTPENKKAFETIANDYAKAREGKWTYGWSFQDNNKAVVIAAWDSVEVSSGDSHQRLF